MLRTYDKLIATISARRGARDLRSFPGVQFRANMTGCAGVCCPMQETG